ELGRCDDSVWAPVLFGRCNFFVFPSQRFAIPEGSFFSDWQRICLRVDSDENFDQHTDFGLRDIQEAVELSCSRDYAKVTRNEPFRERQHLRSDGGAVFQILSIVRSVHIADDRAAHVRWATLFGDVRPPSRTLDFKLTPLPSSSLALTYPAR